MPLSYDKVVDEQLTQLFKRTNIVRRHLVEHTRADPLRVVGKTLHINSFGTPWRCIVVLKVSMWSHGLCVPSYESNKDILNLEGKGWLLMEAMKGESIWWTKSSTWFVLLIFLSISLLIWSISLSKCVTLREAVPLEWFSHSTFFPSLISWL